MDSDPTDTGADKIAGPDECLSFLVRHAWLSMRTVVASALAEHGLSVAQFASLLKLEESPGLSPADIARSMSSARQSANELLVGMERAGLLERRPNPHDRRSQQIYLTEPGRERLRAALPTVQAVEGQLAAGFSDQERDVVHAWLSRMADAATTPAPEEIPTV